MLRESKNGLGWRFLKALPLVTLVLACGPGSDPGGDDNNDDDPSEEPSTVTPTATATGSGTATPTGSASPTPTATGMPTPTRGSTPTPTHKGTSTPTPTMGPTPTLLPGQFFCRSVEYWHSSFVDDGDEWDPTARICGAVVTGISRDGSGFFVQDPAGGAYSGVYVFLADEDMPLGLEAGDEVEVLGYWTELNGVDQLSLEDPTTIYSYIVITAKGQPLPEPVIVSDLSAISTTGCDTPIHGSMVQAYEGARVAVRGVTVTDLDPCGKGPLGAFEVGDSLLIDDDLGMNYEPMLGQSLEEVTGVLHTSANAARLLPNIDGVIPAP